jgi:hypothetical protein
MSIIRPSNINKRLVGTATTAKGGSPGNAGQIGPTKTPYIAANKGGCTTLSLGQRSCGVGGCPGVFKASESFCGRINNCQIPFFDLGGNLICAAAGVRWVLAPETSEVCRTWYARNDASTTAQQVTGCTGWFVPTRDQGNTIGACNSVYWDGTIPAGTWYWSSTDCGSYQMPDGGGRAAFSYDQSNVWNTRAFRCVTY